MSADQGRIDAALDGATRVARGCFGPGVAIGEVTVIAARARSVVLRCELPHQPDLPRSIIAKLHTGDDARGFSDWASLAFLSGIETARGVAPRFYGGDPAQRLYLMEDLGPSRSIADLMATNDATALRGAVRALAAPMARLIAATAGPGQEARYERLRGALPGGQDANRHAEARRWRAAWPRVATWFDAFGCPIGADVEAAVARVAECYAEPGPFLGFSHGDPAPSNNQIGPHAAHLLDFEYGAFRHALYDITGWYVLCPLPETWAAELHATFRRHLAGTWPPLADEGSYQAGWATMCAYRALAMLSWFPLGLLDADRPWVEGWTARAALLTAATRLGLATRETPELAALGEAGERFARAARARWPDLGTALPPWPGAPSPAATAPTGNNPATMAL